jgi:hypothetical protein
VNPNSFRNLEFNWSGLRFWLTLLAIVWLLGTLGLGWIVKSIVVLLALLIITPIIAVLGFRWWLQRNLVEDNCPVCSYRFASINGVETRCPSCGEPLKLEKGHFSRLTPPGTVDVEVVEVSVQQLEDK